MKNNLHILPPILIVLFALCKTQGQTFDIGIEYGLALYDGDFTPNKSFDAIKDVNASLGVHANYYINQRLGFGLYYRKTSLESIDKRSTFPSRITHRNFVTDVREVGLHVDFNVFRFDLEDLGFRIAPYIGSGFVSLSYAPKTKTENGVLALSNDLYKGFGFAVPYKVGIKVRLTTDLYCDFKMTYMQTLVDDIDGDTYLKNDVYVMSSISLMYSIPFYSRIRNRNRISSPTLN